MTKEEIDILWNKAIRESIDDGSLFTRYRFAELVAEAEREAIMDEWWMCVQSDLEHGVKSLNERAAEKWHEEYPAISGFDGTIRARGEDK